MESLVVYDSKFGNTKKVAEAIADGLAGHGPVRLLGLDKIPPQNLGPVDLLFIGGPTQAHAMTARMRQFVVALRARPANGTVVATFDTRLRMPAVISGSAAKTIARKLRSVGVRIFAAPESFFVQGSRPQLEEGETERAANWAKGVSDRLALSHWCAA
jgi:flavorubredoxin